MKRTAVIVGILVVAAAAAGSGLLVARFGEARGFPVSQLKEGVNPATLQITPMFVVRRGGSAFALRPFAPDSQTPVGWCGGQGFFEDPTTGSKWDGDGRYLAGPALRGLDHLRSKIVNGVLQVAPGEVDLGDPRSSYRPAKDLHLYAALTERLDTRRCHCSTTFLDRFGREQPEMDAFAWVPFHEVPTRCAKSLPPPCPTSCARR